MPLEFAVFALQDARVVYRLRIVHFAPLILPLMRLQASVFALRRICFFTAYNLMFV
jgi:hypothetical protein